MYLADYHTHSRVSFDSQAPRVELAAAAVAAGLAELCFTDHYDVIDDQGNFIPDFPWLTARAEHQQALAAFGGKLKLRYGLELGNACADFRAGERAQEEPGLDFVIASVHNLSIAGGRLDFYDVRYDTPELCYTHLDDYFHSLLRVARWGKFDVLGHIPYPLRYMRERDKQPVSLERYRDEIHEILRLVIEQGKGVEVNTKNWSSTVRQNYFDLMTQYRARGGEIVTVGSDAHSPDAVGAHIPEVYAMLRDIGFRYVTAYEGRLPHFIPLEGIAYA